MIIGLCGTHVERAAERIIHLSAVPVREVNAAALDHNQSDELLVVYVRSSRDARLVRGAGGIVVDVYTGGPYENMPHDYTVVDLDGDPRFLDRELLRVLSWCRVPYRSDLFPHSPSRYRS